MRDHPATDLTPSIDALNPPSRRATRHPRLLLAALIAAAPAALPAAASGQAEVGRVSGAGGEWEVHVQNPRYNRVGDVKVARHLGRESLWLRANTHAVLAGESFASGTIEFDLAPMDPSHFFAVMFRRASFREHENIYLRTGKSGEWDAVQYAPRLHGASTWQIYPEFSGPAAFPAGEWTPVRIEVDGTAMAIWVGGGAEPVVRIARLRGEPPRGAIGFWSRVNFDNDAWAAAISNLRVTPRTQDVSGADARSTDADPGSGAGADAATAPDATGALVDWSVAEPIATADHDWSSLPALEGWRDLRAEDTGLVNLTRAFGEPSGPGRVPHTAFARRTIETPAARDATLEIAYSDDVHLYLNGRLLYSGENGWERRYPGYLGLVKLGAESVRLPLRAGRNELVIATTDVRFGWGFKARLAPEGS